MAASGETYGEQNTSTSHVCLDVDIVKELAQVLGMNILEIIIAFATNGEEGSRLTLQKNRDWFTVQETGAVHKTNHEPLDPERMRAIREMLLP